MKCCLTSLRLTNFESGINVFDPKARRNEIELPYIIEVELPENGFDHCVRRSIEEFHLSQKIKVSFGRRRRHGKLDYCRLCFADPVQADAFSRRFGGKLLRVEYPPVGGWAS
jgi:hypothetical protein